MQLHSSINRIWMKETKTVKKGLSRPVSDLVYSYYYSELQNQEQNSCLVHLDHIGGRSRTLYWLIYHTFWTVPRGRPSLWMPPIFAGTEKSINNIALKHSQELLKGSYTHHLTSKVGPIALNLISPPIKMCFKTKKKFNPCSAPPTYRFLIHRFSYLVSL